MLFGKDDGLTDSNTDFYTVAPPISENVQKFICENGAGGSGNLYLYSVKVSRVDPPPTLGSIEDRSIAVTAPLTNETLVVSSELNDDDDGVDDNISLAISAVAGGNVLSVGYAVYERDGAWYYSFSPEEAGVDKGDVEITITPTGDGGTGVPQSFTISVLAAGSPPTVLPILDQDTLALRTLTIPFTVLEPDGDSITTNVVCLTSGVTGTYGTDVNGKFFYAPSLADAEIGTIEFRIDATDEQDTGSSAFTVMVAAGMPPALGAIADQTVAYDGTNKVTLALTPTDDDAITVTNVDVKVGTTAPVGERTFSDLVFRFVPATADIGQTFTFTASATDFDGTTNVDFNVEVILAAPVLKHCSVEAWTATSFTADLKSAVPGATSYRLRHIHTAANDTVVTGYVDNVSFPYVVSGLDSTTYTYAVQAQCGAINSAWSNEETVHLDTYLPPTYAIPMTGNAHGSYSQNFDSLPSSGSGIWYDARTIPGWYVTFDGKSFTDGTIQTWRYGANNTATGFFSFGTEKGVDVNRGIGVKNSKWADDFRFGVAFTNTCQYAVTNINVSFTACQFRYGKGYTQLQLSHVVSNSVQSLTSSGWKDDKAFYFDPDLSTNAMAMDPQYTRRFSGDIPLTGNDTLHTGQIFMLRWQNFAADNSVPVGIDDLEVKWECAWPRQTVIILQ